MLIWLIQRFEVDILELEGVGDSDSFVFGKGLRNKYEKVFIERRRRRRRKNLKNLVLVKVEEVRNVELVFF